MFFQFVCSTLSPSVQCSLFIVEPVHLLRLSLSLVQCSLVEESSCVAIPPPLLLVFTRNRSTSSSSAIAIVTATTTTATATTSVDALFSRRRLLLLLRQSSQIYKFSNFRFVGLQKIKNPNYKGKWKTPWIDNPEDTVNVDSEMTKIVAMALYGFYGLEFEDDPHLYVLKPIKYVGIEVWQDAFEEAEKARRAKEEEEQDCGAEIVITLTVTEEVVPEAYREWEVKVFDWQTQCPTLAKPEDSIFFYKSIKLLPTVGCEADAATQYSIDERNIGGADDSASAFAYRSSGCYAAVWLMEDHATYRLLELEHCLIDPRNQESRVQIIRVVRVEKSKFMLQNIKVFYALKSSEVTGVWQGLHAVACFQNSQTNALQELLDDSVQKSVRDDQNLVLLPKQLWSSLKEREDGQTCCGVGWLLDQGQAITSKCIFSPDAGLKASIFLVGMMGSTSMVLQVPATVDEGDGRVGVVGPFQSKGFMEGLEQ
ncbi:hypothetical protein TEA_010331 [Camellia sinensis var. sinensis]|uniref:Uncharacterized protein n=1 Tax=Camellia sinensis var. sinensis TaxID=542762 RepID=A0A4S4DY25_CAMSN|nr:hypothetical protein TEA_010331 [Camellia sinensis var. sinensis]